MRQYLGLFLPIIILAVAAALDVRRLISWDGLDKHIVPIAIILGSAFDGSLAMILYACLRINHNREDDCLTPPPGGGNWKRDSQT